MNAPKKPRTPRGQRPRHDALTYVYPRTLEEAFGPGEGGPVVPMVDADASPGVLEMTWGAKAVVLAIPIVCLVAFFVSIITGLMP